ncbi:hypothetical protein Ae406Ps2_4775 [Pseudonocardia sp. Ae406_Ps2]|nr:hypothetical protein Ae331Ps2_1179c [Pseudonocardia sp. Ae331_Ps2]OLM04775.1 hypothetical protein Ae406Ps2_4775 [Pseudonocardia sp. Ae406_Ps2]OLM26343.1 hypothetical protein Ae706Ps2_4776 [Pseudonocardia sp. Ae706_Ps2]
MLGRTPLVITGRCGDRLSRKVCEGVPGLTRQDERVHPAGSGVTRR